MSLRSAEQAVNVIVTGFNDFLERGDTSLVALLHIITDALGPQYSPGYCGWMLQNLRNNWSRPKALTQFLEVSVDKNRLHRVTAGLDPWLMQQIEEKRSRRDFEFEVLFDAQKRLRQIHNATFFQGTSNPYICEVLDTSAHLDL